MIVRILTATDAAATVQRVAGVLPAAGASRIVAAARTAILIDDAPGARVAHLVRAFAATGATVERSQHGALVVAASGEQLASAFAAGDPDDRPALQRFIDAHARDAQPPVTLRLRNRTLDLRDEARVMGIVNVTPDSFYDRAAGLDDVVARTQAIAACGGAIVDVGGQSYASWNARIGADEESARVVPAVAAIRAAGIDLAISIDTFKATVAEGALQAGAHAINDCSGLSDPRLVEVVARYDAALVVMHLKGELNVRDPQGYVYGDAMREIIEFLYERTERALAAGVARDSIVVDPGLEFGKEPATDLEILDRFGELRALGYPILFASSRKSFIGRIFGRPARELLVPSLATAGVGIAAGARLVRVHDVPETVQLARMYAAIAPGRRSALDISVQMPEANGNLPARGVV